jgi:hypothetical protein
MPRIRQHGLASFLRRARALFVKNATRGRQVYKTPAGAWIVVSPADDGHVMVQTFKGGACPC